MIMDPLAPPTALLDPPPFAYTEITVDEEIVMEPAGPPPASY